jgi:putative FmdB family regulatory protein
MPAYDFRCKVCGTPFTLTYKSYRDYDAAEKHCPNCNSVELARVIKRINVQAPGRDYSRMTSDEMLKVFESGDSRQVGQMFDQVGGTSPELGMQFQETTKRLLSGESMESVERSLQDQDASRRGVDAPAAPPPAAPSAPASSGE